MTRTYTHTLKADDHPVKSVTIFKSSTAEVVRTFSIDLQAGENRLEIKGLSSHIDTDSARVSGLGDGVRLFDVVCNIKQPVNPEDDDPSEEVRRLELQRQELETEKKVHEHEADILINYGKTLKGEHVSPEQASEFLQIFLENGKRNMKAVTKLKEDITLVDRKIAQLRDKMLEKTGSAHGQAAITLSTKSAGPVEIKLTYIVNFASWEPTYDLHASTEDGRPSSSVQLHYRARITQNTGEDWRDTALVLSTSASDGNAKGAPELKSLTVTHGVEQNTWVSQRPAPMAREMARKTRTQAAYPPPPARHAPRYEPTSPAFSPTSPPGAAAAYGRDRDGEVYIHQVHRAAAPVTAYLLSADDEAADTLGDTYEEVAQPGPLAGPTTVVSESPLSMTYTVDGKSSIPSDGIAHQVLVALLSFEADVTYVAVPRVETVAYLQCEVKNTSDYRLLPGSVSVFLDDSFVSKTTIHDVNSGDTFQCTLGADPSIRLTFVRTSNTGAIEGGAFAEQFKTTTYKTVTTIKNRHRFALARLLVRDSVPLVRPEDKRTRVVLCKPAGLADAEPTAEVEVDGAVVRWFQEEGKTAEKDGKIEWEAKVESGAEVKLDLEYDVRGSAEAYWILKAT